MSGLVAAEVKRALKLPFVTFHVLGRVRRLHQGEADKFRLAGSTSKRGRGRGGPIIAECPQDEADLIQFYLRPTRPRSGLFPAA